METGQMSVSQGDNDSLGTIASRQATARDQGEEFTENDWVALVQELVAGGNERIGVRAFHVLADRVGTR
jgi:hypothetical protein